MTSLLPVLPREHPPAELEALARLLRIQASGEGALATSLPALTLYRFAADSRCVKAVTHGVQVGIVAQGRKRLKVAGLSTVIEAGQCVVLTRETEHSSDVAGPFLGLSLSFSAEQVAKALLAVTEAGVQAAGRECSPAFVVTADGGLLAAAERLLRCLADPLDRTLLAPLAVEELLFRLLRTDAAAAVRCTATQCSDGDRILRAMQYMRAHWADPLSVPRIAREVAMSPSHFAHRFRAVARTSPMRYLRELKLERARSLLLAGNARAGEVATQVGYESPSHFTREFKRRFGAPPATYARASAKREEA